MYLKLLIFCLASVSIINCEHICEEGNGHFENIDDRTSYYECTDGKSYLRRCPKAKDGLSYLVFDGKECVEPYPAFVCPQETGKYRNIHNDRQFYECFKNKPILKNCPKNTRFDGLKCVLDKNKTVSGDHQQEELDFICPSSTGDYPNPENRHSYIECRDDIPRLKRCPREGSAVHLHGAKRKHRKRLIWDGHQCIQSHRYGDNRSSRQAPENRAQDYMFTCPLPEGRFPDPRDSHYYFHCQNAQPRQIICPGDTIFNEGRGGCVHPSNHLNPSRRQAQVDLTCPSGTFYDDETGRCRREEFADPIEVSGPVLIEEGSPQCPADTTYDSRTGQCRREILVDPIRTPVVVQSQVTTTCPTGFTYNQARNQCIRETLVDPIPNVEPQRRCPSGYVFDVSRGQCVRETLVEPINPSYGRYRRNGRVETEDSINGAVIVDTWNEHQWRWDRDPNGQRILPDVNGWLDRQHAYAHAQRNAPNIEYAQGRPVHYARY